MLLHPVYQILHLYPRLTLVRQVPDERVLEQHLGVGPLVVVLDQDRLDKALELGAPPLRLESRRGIPGDEEERPHRMHVAEGRLSLGHLETRDSQRPQVGPVVVRRVGVLITGNDLNGEKAEFDKRETTLEHFENYRDLRKK